MHHVLAQKVGVQSALGVIHLAVLSRLVAQGVLPAGTSVALPPGGGRPFTRPAGSPALAPSASPAGLLHAQLDGLARAYWAWEWRPEDASGFLPAARALTDAAAGTDRVGTMLGGVVMQASGRPFGDCERATLQFERLLALAGGVGSARRDLAVLQAHRGLKGEALCNLKLYVGSEAGRAAVVAAGAPEATPLQRAEAGAVEALLLVLSRASLEASLRQDAASESQ